MDVGVNTEPGGCRAPILIDTQNKNETIHTNALNKEALFM